MRVWVLDDAHFPSGFCNGKIAPDSPYGKVYLTQYGVDIVGPKQGRSVLIILEQGEELVAVTMGKRDRNNQDSLTEVKDLTSQVSDGRVLDVYKRQVHGIFKPRCIRNGCRCRGFGKTYSHYVKCIESRIF